MLLIFYNRVSSLNISYYYTNYSQILHYLHYYTISYYTITDTIYIQVYKRPVLTLSDNNKRLKTLIVTII